MAGNGAFYTLPNANDVCFGHLCDLIYVDDERSKNDRAEWDKASTSEKLGVCAVCMYGAGQLRESHRSIFLAAMSRI